MSRILRVLSIVGFAAMLVLGLALAAYGWGQMSTSVPGWGRALVILGVGTALVAALALALPFAWRMSLAATLAAAGFALFLGNWLLLQPPAHVDVVAQRAELAARDGIDYDRREHHEVVLDLRAQGVPAQPVVSPGVLVLDHIMGDEQVRAMSVFPLGGISHTPTVVCNESGSYLVIDSDRHGFNNPDELYDRDARVVLIGDSFSFGYCVETGDSFASQLRGRGYPLLSLGYPGTGPLIQLAQLREFGTLVRPEVVLWQFYAGNDLVNLMDEFEHPVLRRYLQPDFDQGITERQDEVDAWMADLVDSRLEDVQHERYAERSTLWNLVTLARLRRHFGLTRRDFDHSPFERLATVATAIKQETERLGAELHFVYLPTYSDITSERPPIRDQVFEVVAAAGIPIIDFEKRVLALPDPLEVFPFGLHGHFNALGNRLLADLVIEEVLDDYELVAGAHAAAVPSPGGALAETPDGASSPPAQMR